MAFPYSTNPPPPTNAPLSIVNSANSGTSYFAPASGGGSGPSSSFNVASISSLTVSSINGAIPNPPLPQSITVESLIVNTDGYIDAPAASGSLRFEALIDTPSGAHLLYLSSGVNTSALSFYPSTISVDYADLQVTTINGKPPAITSYSEPDIGSLFSTLFAANPTLSTIMY